jgi:hypothetical protein
MYIRGKRSKIYPKTMTHYIKNDHWSKVRGYARSRSYKLFQSKSGELNRYWSWSIGLY